MFSLCIGVVGVGHGKLQEIIKQCGEAIYKTVMLNIVINAGRKNYLFVELFRYVPMVKSMKSHINGKVCSKLHLAPLCHI